MAFARNCDNADDGNEDDEWVRPLDDAKCGEWDRVWLGGKFAAADTATAASIAPAFVVIVLFFLEALLPSGSETWESFCSADGLLTRGDERRIWLPVAMLVLVLVFFTIVVLVVVVAAAFAVFRVVVDVVVAVPDPPTMRVKVGDTTKRIPRFVVVVNEPARRVRTTRSSVARGLRLLKSLNMTFSQ